MSGIARVQVEFRSGHGRGYEVLIGSDLLAGAGKSLQAWLQPARWGLVADAAVDKLYAGRIEASLRDAGAEVFRCRVASGEASKSRDTLGRLQDELVAAGLGRDAALLAMGGGVVGDLVGFAAATLYRGIPYVQLPTTLLAMVDSSVGGKTGIDIAAGKNLVGAFHQPAGVLADVDTLATLPVDQISSGLAEVIKYGVILDPQLFVDLEDGLLESCRAAVSGAVVNIVERSVALKASVVAEDEREMGRRAILNFGHTIGHAVESASAFGLSHGAAVAIGMLAEARLACRLLGAPRELPVRLDGLCRRAGLPTALPAGISIGDVLAAARHDKKGRNGVLHCALPCALGEMARGDDSWTIPVDESQVRGALGG